MITDYGKSLASLTTLLATDAPASPHLHETAGDAS